MQARLGGLFARHSGRAPTRDPARLEARVLERTLKHKPRDGSTHWSGELAELKLPLRMTVQRIWRKHNVQPHLRKRHMISNSTQDFKNKAADVIGLYLTAHAAVYCVLDLPLVIRANHSWKTARLGTG